MPQQVSVTLTQHHVRATFSATLPQHHVHTHSVSPCHGIMSESFQYHAASCQHHAASCQHHVRSHFGPSHLCRVAFCHRSASTRAMSSSWPSGASSCLWTHGLVSRSPLTRRQALPADVLQHPVREGREGCRARCSAAQWRQQQEQPRLGHRALPEAQEAGR